MTLLEAVDYGHHEHQPKSCPVSTTVTAVSQFAHSSATFYDFLSPFTIPLTPASFHLLFPVSTDLRVSFGMAQQRSDVKCSDRGEEEYA